MPRFFHFPIAELVCLSIATATLTANPPMPPSQIQPSSASTATPRDASSEEDRKGSTASADVEETSDPRGIAWLEKESRYWPLFITITRAWPDMPGQNPLIPAGWPAVLIRVENGAILTDVGRMGRHALPVEFTDALQQARGFADGTEKKAAGNITMQILNRCFDATDKDNRSINPLHFEGIEKYLILYARGDDSASRELIGQLIEQYPLWRSRSKQLEVLHISQAQTNEKIMECIKSLKMPWPCLQPFLCASYTKAFHHEPGEGPCLVLIDADGKILDHSRRYPTLEEGFTRLRKAAEATLPKIVPTP